MGFQKTITEESEYGGGKTIVKKVITPHIVSQDDYQVLMSIAMSVIREAVQKGRMGDFGVHFFVDANKRLVKRAESFYTESVTKIAADQ